MEWSENREYKYFLKIAEKRNITKAAEELYVSQPSLSKFLNHLEKRIGAPLFNRQDSFSLTPAGLSYLKYIRGVQGLQHDFVCELQNQEEYETAVFRLGITPWRAASIIPGLMAMFSEQYPHTRLEVTEESNAVLRRRFRKGDLDLYISISPLLLSGGAPEPDGLKSLLLYRDSLVLLVPASLLPVGIRRISRDPRKPEPIDPALLRGCSVITSKPGKALYDCIGQIAAKYRMEPSSLLETANIENAVRLAAGGSGITFVPLSFLGKSLFPETLYFFTSDDSLFHCWDVYAHFDPSSLGAMKYAVSEMLQTLAPRPGLSRPEVGE